MLTLQVKLLHHIGLTFCYRTTKMTELVQLETFKLAGAQHLL
jgi:hypothetical protein